MTVLAYAFVALAQIHCPQQQKNIDLDVPHKIVERSNFNQDADVRIGASGDVIQLRAGAGGRASRARVVLRGVRGRVDLKWRDPACRQPNGLDERKKQP